MWGQWTHGGQGGGRARTQQPALTQLPSPQRATTSHPQLPAQQPGSVISRKHSKPQTPIIHSNHCFCIPCSREPVRWETAVTNTWKSQLVNGCKGIVGARHSHRCTAENETSFKFQDKLTKCQHLSHLKGTLSILLGNTL